MQMLLSNHFSHSITSPNIPFAINSFIPAHLWIFNYFMDTPVLDSIGFQIQCHRVLSPRSMASSYPDPSLHVVSSGKVGLLVNNFQQQSPQQPCAPSTFQFKRRISLMHAKGNSEFFQRHATPSPLVQPQSWLQQDSCVAYLHKYLSLPFYAFLLVEQHYCLQWCKYFQQKTTHIHFIYSDATAQLPTTVADYGPHGDCQGCRVWSWKWRLEGVKILEFQPACAKLLPTEAFFFRPLRLRAWSVWTQCPRNLNWILLWLTLDAVCLRGLCGRSALPVSFHYLLDSSCGFLIPKTFGGRSMEEMPVETFAKVKHSFDVPSRS